MEVVASGGVDVFVVKFRKRSGTVGQIEVPQGADSIAEAAQHQPNVLSQKGQAGEFPAKFRVEETNARTGDPVVQEAADSPVTTESRIVINRASRGIKRNGVPWSIAQEFLIVKAVGKDNILLY